MNSMPMAGRVLIVSGLLGGCLCFLLPVLRALEVNAASDKRLSPKLALEEVPCAAVPTEGVPEPAAWPAARPERRMRFLAVVAQREAASPYQRIARRCGASLELLNGIWGKNIDEIFLLAHTNDKWIEAKKDPSVEEVTERANLAKHETLASAAGRFDVVFCPQPEPELEAYVKAGGVWVICGTVSPSADSPLAALWPARPGKRNSWALRRRRPGRRHGARGAALGAPGWTSMAWPVRSGGWSEGVGGGRVWCGLHAARREGSRRPCPDRPDLAEVRRYRAVPAGV